MNLEIMQRQLSASVAILALVSLLVPCLLVQGTIDEVNLNSIEYVSRQRSLCNTFGGCGAARSMSPSGSISSSEPRRQMRMVAPYVQQDQSPRSNFRFNSRSLGRAALGPFAGASSQGEAESKQRQQQEQQPLDLIMHSARMNHLVEDQAGLDMIGRGMRSRRSQ